MVRILAALLVPWTAPAAAVDPAWFPAPWVQGFWVVFDVLLCASLLVLSVRWRAWLATLLLAPLLTPTREDVEDQRSGPQAGWHIRRSGKVQHAIHRDGCVCFAYPHKTETTGKGGNRHPYNLGGEP